MTPTALRMFSAALLLFSACSALAQTARPINVVTTAVPFLRISPDARSGGMGDVSLATDADAASPYFNLGKVPFNTSTGGINITYTPWLKKVVNDVYLLSAAGYIKLTEDQAISASLRYFSLGSIQFTNESGQSLGSQNPRELAAQVNYSRKLSDKFGLGIGLKYINSKLATGSFGSSTYKPGNAVAADLGLYYNGHNEAGQGWAFGLALNNLGTKIAYTDATDQKDYIPANFGIGTTYTKVLDEENKIAFGLDINKLMVPTPPLATGNYSQDSANYANYRKTTVLSSWTKSFGDAPDGFSEELKEFQVSVGAEYTYASQFSVRAGYFYENKTKGNRRYFTAGVGVKYNIVGLHFSYLAPSGSGINQNPLSNTLRFSLVFDLDSDK